MTQIFPKPRAGATEKPEVYFAAFGKHPGWNDHIDDLGLETDLLVAFKRVLYLEGISGAIESGAWEKLDADRRVEGFGHVVVSRVRGEWLAARLWSSSDGKGRTKYPMVVAVHARGVGLDWILNKALPAMERVQGRCVEAMSAGVVTAIMDTARAELRTVLPASAETADVAPAKALAELAEQPSLGGGPSEREGLYRLLYSVQRDWEAFVGGASPRTGSRTKMLDARAQHARVPACGTTVADSVRRWMGFMRRVVSDSAAKMVIIPMGGGAREPMWADLVVGDAAGSQYFCLRASVKAIPPVTDVPFSLDEAFVRECDERIERSRRGEPVPTAASDRISTRTPGFLSKLFGSKRSLLFLGLAVGLIGAGTLIIWLTTKSKPTASAPGGGSSIASGGGDRSGKPRDGPAASNGSSGNQSGGNVGTTSTPPTPIASNDPSRAAWEQLCDQFNDWASSFIQRLDERPRGTTVASRREYYQNDAYLSRALSPLLSAIREGKPLDPRSIAGVARDERFAVIRKDPPASAMTPSAKDRTAAAVTVLDSVRNGLSAELWPAAGDLKSIESSLRTLGRTRDADAVLAAIRGVTIGATRDLALGVDQVLAVQSVAASLRSRLASIETALASAKNADDPEIARMPEWITAQFAAVPPLPESSNDILGMLQSLDAAGGTVADAAGPIGAFLTASGSNIDRAVLTPRRGADAATKPISRESLRSWLEDARASLKLSPDLDPRKSWKAEALLAQAAATRQKIEKELRATAEPVAVETERSLGQKVESLRAQQWNAGTKAQLDEAIPALERDLTSLNQRYDNAYATERLRVQGSAKEVREQLRAQTTIVSRSEAINAAWRAERDRLLAKHDDAHFPQLALEAGTVRERLVKLDDAVPAGPTFDNDGRRWATSLAQAAANEREEAIRQSLDEWTKVGGAAADADGSRLVAITGRIADRVKGWQEQLSQLATGATRIERLLDDAYGYREPAVATGGAPGTTIADALAAIEKMDAMKSASIRDALAVLVERARALERLESTTDRLELASAVSSATTSTPERMVVGWRRLGALPAPGWPTTVKQLDDELAMQRRVGEALAVVRDSERVKRIESELSAERRRRWEVCFAGATDAAEIEGAADRASAFGVDAASLPDRLRYNLELARLRKRVGESAASPLADADTVKAASDFGALAKAMGSGISAAPAVAPVLEKLGEIAAPNVPATPKVDVTKLGPAGAGWTGRMDGEIAEFVRTTGDGKTVTLRFVRIEPSGGPVAYIAQDEVSLAQAVGIVDANGAWGELRTLWAEEESDSRFGPRVWRWSSPTRASAKVRVCERWQQEVFRMSSPPADTPAELSVPVPSGECPMNYLSAAAASFVAALAGTRLPTSAEWQAAYSAAGDGAAAGANLRDATWKAQQEYVRKIRDSKRSAVPPEVQWPDAGMFQVAQAARGENAVARTTQDGVLWFAPTGAGKSAMSASNIVGNVAEYVVDAEPPSVGVGPSARAASVEAYISSHSKQVFVIGGSALSAPEAPIDKPLSLVEPDEPTSGYSDVGFRLAFTAEGAAPTPEPMFGRLARVVAEAMYLKP